MTKFSRWVTKHYTILNRAVTLLWAGLAVALIWLWEWPMLLALLIYLIGTVACSMLMVRCGDRLRREVIRQSTQECDPEPLCQEMEAQLTYSLPPMQMLMCEINYALALTHSGRFAEAYDRLNQINIAHPRIPPYIRTVYYTNRLDLCFQMEKYQEVEELHEKMLRTFEGMKPGKAKETIRPTVEGNTALYHFCREEYDEARQIWERAKPEKTVDRVFHALLQAKLDLTMGNQDRAKERLQFVLEHGNKLNFVTEARALLAEINMEESSI